MQINSHLNPFMFQGRQELAEPQNDQAFRRAPQNNQGETESTTTRFSADDLKKTLNDNIVNALEKALSQKDVARLYQLQPQDVTPEKVASRVLGFIGRALQGLEQGSDEFNAKLDQARHGVEKGFSQAKDILTGLGVYQDQIQDNAESTYDKIQAGLAQLASPSAANESEAYQSASHSLRQSLSIQVKTNEGDLVTIHVKNSYGEHSTLHASSNDHQTAMHFQRASYSKESLSYSVEGELDDQELAAIENLVSQINQVSDTFFSGDTQAAFAQAQQIGYDSNELAGYNLKIKEVQQSRATSAYNHVARLDEQAPSTGTHARQAFNDFLNQFFESYQRVEANAMIEDKERTFLDLFNGLSRQDDNKAHQIAQLEQSGKRFEDMTKALLSNLTNRL